jgi:Uma2 family endonuclease
MSASYLDTASPPPADAPLAPERMSEEAFVKWVLVHNVKAEWVDSEVILMSPANWQHTSLRRWLDGLLTDFVEARSLGIVGDDTLVRLEQGRRLRIPDIFFVTQNRLAIIQPTMLIEAPDFIVEIVSPDSAARDWRDKYLEYQACGVREYWVIDPAAGAYDVYVLDANRQYHSMPFADGVIRSTAVTGFWIRAEWLSPERRPSKSDALRQVLATTDV